MVVDAGVVRPGRRVRGARPGPREARGRVRAGVAAAEHGRIVWHT